MTKLSRKTLSILAQVLLAVSFASGSNTVVKADASAPTPPSKSLHVVWEYETDAARNQGVQDMSVGDGRVYFRCVNVVGSVDGATGRPIWSHGIPNTPPEAVSNGLREYRQYYLVAGLDLLYDFGRADTGNQPAASYTLCTWNKRTGVPGWQRRFKNGAAGRPVAIGNLLLLALSDGTITALNGATGAPIWSQHVDVAGRFSIELCADKSVIVAQVGSGRLAAFRTADGAPMWEYDRAIKITANDNNESHGPVLENGIVYALLNSAELVAIQAASGKPLWSRVTNSKIESNQSGRVFVIGDYVAADIHTGLGIVYKLTGEPVHRVGATAPTFYQDQIFSLLSPTEAASRTSLMSLYSYDREAPIISGSARVLLSLPSVPVLLKRNERNGSEEWRARVQDLPYWTQIASDGARLYAAVDGRIVRLESGEPRSMPALQADRDSLAKWAAAAIFDRDAAMKMNGSKTALLNGSPPRYLPLSKERATLTLVKLGTASVPHILKYIRREVLDLDSRPGSFANQINYVGFPEKLTDACNLMDDIGDRSSTVELAHILDSAQLPISRRLIARTLIRIGDPRSRPALLKYARTIPNDLQTQLDALYFVASAPPDSAISIELTRFLLTILNNDSASIQMRLFARFELLNNRGDDSRIAALNAFERCGSAPLVPAGFTMKLNEAHTRVVSSSSYPAGPHGMHGIEDASILAVGKDAHGVYRCVFVCDLAGRYDDVWTARSADGITWTQPVALFNLHEQNTNVDRAKRLHLTFDESTMTLCWDDVITGAGAKQVPRSVPIWLETIDHAAETTGIAPLLASSTCAVEPPWRHDLPWQAQILQAVVEALCQVGWEDKSGGSMGRFGRPDAPLILPRPPGTEYVPISGHPGPVVTRDPGDRNATSSEWFDGVTHFTPPHIGFDGKFTSPNASFSYSDWATDPFNTRAVGASATPPPARFSSLFPYETSADGMRVRIGVVQTVNMIHTDTAGYDVELRNIDGKWYPVSCRFLYHYRGFLRGDTGPALPIVR